LWHPNWTWPRTRPVCFSAPSLGPKSLLESSSILVMDRSPK
jgi:hypothetical protein